MPYDKKNKAKYYIENKAAITAQRKKSYDNSPEYAVWHEMIARCTNPKNKQWSNYGGANPPVTVCKRWLTFENFLADMGKRPSSKFSLSRLLDGLLYGPKLVVWGTRAHQQMQKFVKQGLAKNGPFAFYQVVEERLAA